MRETRPETVEFRHADGMRKSSRVPKRPHAATGIGEHREVVDEDDAGCPCVLGQRGGQLAGDGALARPPVHEDDVGRIVVRAEVPQRDLVDAAAADDGQRVVGGLDAVGLHEPPADEDPDRRPGAREGRERQVRSALRQQDLADDADSDRDAARCVGDGDVEETLVLGVGLYSCGSDSA